MRGVDELFALEVLVLHSSLIYLDSFDSNNSFLLGQEACRRGRVGEEEPENYRYNKRDQASDDHEPIVTEYPSIPAIHP